MFNGGLFDIYLISKSHTYFYEYYEVQTTFKIDIKITCHALNRQQRYTYLTFSSKLVI
jgi:hypothetical protein